MIAILNFLYGIAQTSIGYIKKRQIGEKVSSCMLLCVIMFSIMGISRRLTVESTFVILINVSWCILILELLHCILVSVFALFFMVGIH